MLFSILMIILGFILLVVGADFLVKGASNIAKKFHIPEMLIGLTIVALGTSMPELIITINSATSGANDLIIGNAIGSNLCNLLLILGLMCVIRPVEIDKEAVKVHIPMAFISAVTILCLSLGIFSTPNVIDRRDGIILTIMFVLYFLYPIFAEIKDIKEAYKENLKSDKFKDIKISLSILFIVLGIVLLKYVLFIVLGIVLLKYGGDFVVDYATNIAMELNVPESVIGLTIIAIGTAMPELVTSIVAVIKKDTDLAVGNLVGSCVLNLFLILGVGAIITPLNFSQDFNNNLIYLIISTFVIWCFNFVGKKHILTREKGVILLLMFGFYIVRLFHF